MTLQLARIYDSRLAQASFLVWCDTTREALVVDPARHIAPYLERAAQLGLRITRVTETHIHADFVSGTRELAAATGAAILLSGAGTADWQYEYAARDHATLLHDQSEFAFGTVHVTALHTPGHTPEHLAFLLRDTSSEAPVAMLSGDFLFVGDVGRPDLLERVAGVTGNAKEGAGQLFDSLQRLAAFPDTLQVWPGHGAGSACGRSLGAAPATTLGHERATNWSLQVTDRDTFIAAVLEGQPPAPPYFARMKAINRRGPDLLGTQPPLAQLDEKALPHAVAAGVLIDTRTSAERAAARIRGSIHLPFNSAFTKWAGWLLSPDRALYLIASPGEIAAVRAALQSIGLDRVVAAFSSDAVARSADAEHGANPTHTMRESEALARDGVIVVDVRDADEWNAGHLDHAVHHPLGTLPDTIRDLDRQKTVAVHCQGGTRSAIAGSLLEAMGFRRVIELPGGWGEWMESPKG